MKTGFSSLQPVLRAENELTRVASRRAEAWGRALDKSAGDSAYGTPSGADDT